MGKKRGAAVLAVWILGSALEALLVGKIDSQETPVGLALAALAAFVAIGALAASGADIEVGVAALAHLPKLAATVVLDTAKVTAVLVGALRGAAPRDRIVRVPVDPGGEGARDAGRRALMVAGTSAGPNSVVIDLDRKGGALVVHVLAP